MILLFADDLTGAAELAGIALQGGMRVGFFTSPNISCITTDYDLLVFASDIRSTDWGKARPVVCAYMDTIRSIDPQRLFIKVDSALRGHIEPLLRCCMEMTNKQKTLLLPANPSLKRTIDHQIYQIAGKPIHSTLFANDPEFPVVESDVTTRFPSFAYITPNNLTFETPIAIGACADLSMLSRYAPLMDDPMLLVAGAADAFRLFCAIESPATFAPWSSLQNRKSLILLGSTAQQHPPIEGSEIAPLPRTIYDGADSTEWIDQLTDRFASIPALTLTIPFPPQGGHNTACRLRSLFADAAERLVRQTSIPPLDLLIIEGGATAFAVLRRLEWNTFAVEQLLAPGVVLLRSLNSSHQVLLKPGSYHWVGKTDC